jgi:hypothetical protein
MDLTKLSDNDLMALKAGDLTKVSDEGLMHLKGESQSKPYMPADLVKNVIGGAIRGAGSIGATFAWPFESADENTARRARLDENMQNLLGADPTSLVYQGAKLGGEVAGTAGLGPAIGGTLKAVPIIRGLPIVDAITTGGMTGGNMATRMAGGAITGGATDLATGGNGVAGAGLGAVAPPLFKGAGVVGELAGNTVRKLFSVSPEVADLAKRAKDLGIDIPADRLANSKPLNAVASSLNYVPFSGRSATEERMHSQLNQALSRTFGQDSSNVTMALRKADEKLGGEFERVLSNNGVAVDKQFLGDMADVYNKAERELGSDALKPIANNINELMTKGQSGVIDGQAAYNIKRDLDRLGRGNTPAAYHAIELKAKLMDALNRSLGPEQAAAFAQTRQHYGNMLALEKLAKNGVEGEVSAARLANMQNINNQPLQELADIAAQFVKGREGQHGAAQRAAAGALTFGLAGAPGVAAGVATGRTANALLNSETLKRTMLNEPGAKNKLMELLQTPEAQQLMYRLAPQGANVAR